MKNLPLITIGSILLIACQTTPSNKTTDTGEVKKQIGVLSKKLTSLEKNDSLNQFISLYTNDAICMPEYQPTLQGKDEIEAYYKEIFQRQNVASFERTIDDILPLDSTFVEIGTFTKQYRYQNNETLRSQNGKYWTVWSLESDESLKLKGESYGFFTSIDNPKDLVVFSKSASTVNAQEMPFELRAYNALNEKYVKDGEGALRADFYTNDCKFMPFAHPTVTGMDALKPYLIQYDTHSKAFWIDSISVYTYAYEYFDNRNSILEYTKFHVRWSTPDFSSSTEGKGVRLWKRQDDLSLKIFREIGTHNFID